MRCPMCGEDDSVLVTPGCRDDATNSLLSWKVCRNCDYGINEHTEGECDCA